MQAIVSLLQQHPLYIVLAAFACGGWLGFFTAMSLAAAEDIAPSNPPAKITGMRIVTGCLTAAGALVVGYAVYALLAPVYAGGVF
jgi:hypothetical protein